MIRPEELRIGNWVYNPTIRTNMQVYPMMIPQLHRIVSEGGQPNIEPILLTEDILLKCGFKSYGTEILYQDQLNNLEAYKHPMKDGYGFALKGCYTLSHVKYLHQLQNLFYSLTGKELEVKL